jgi:RimJ/RimL family protein N-acetyltransferase
MRVLGIGDPAVEGGRVRLRRATMADVGLLELWQSVEYRGEFNDFGLPFQSVSGAVLESGLIGEHGGTLMVESVTNDTPVGTVTWRTVRYGPNLESNAWQIGISLVPDARGHGLGSEAQRLLADHLIATTPVHRIEAMTDVENKFEQHALAKAGFAREGVLRSAQYRAGDWHDLVVFSRVRDR